MKPIELPKFWFRPPDEWDANIMKEFPHVVELTRANLGKHYDITQEIRGSNLKGRVTWRGPIFYFKDKEEAVMFKLKWG